jgi:molybdopterin converting factor small subunit
MITCTIELYGVSAELAGTNEVVVELPGENTGMQELVEVLRKRLPELDGIVLKHNENMLMDNQAFNIDGIFYSGSDDITVHDGDRVRLLTAAIGG